MNALLDTHIWIWLLEDPSKIAPPILRQLETADSLALSVASIWEIAIKTELNRIARVVDQRKRATWFAIKWGWARNVPKVEQRAASRSSTVL